MSLLHAPPRIAPQLSPRRALTRRSRPDTGKVKAFFVACNIPVSYIQRMPSGAILNCRSSNPPQNRPTSDVVGRGKGHQRPASLDITRLTVASHIGAHSPSLGAQAHAC